jgi:predicted O-methyltransferase YrrM
VEASLGRAATLGFAMSCEPGVGQLVAVLAARVPPGGRVLEIGTGAGVGTAWLVDGLGGRTDVEVVTIELDEVVAASVDDGTWPPFVRFLVGDALEVMPTLGRFDVVFADAPAGKWVGLEHTIAALEPGGVLVVDDMAPAEWVDDEHRRNTTRVRGELLAHPDLVAVALDWSSGVVLAARRRGGDGFR